MLPDKAILASFLDAIFRHCAPEGRIAFKAFDGSDKPVFSTSSLALAHGTLVDSTFNLAKAAAKCGRTAVFCPPVCTFRDTWAELNRQATTTDAVLEGPALSVDADASPHAAYERLVAILGEPTVLVLSGGEWIDPETGEVQEKVHLHWRLDVPARGPEALLQLHEARWLACKIAGGDGTGAPVAHPLRWPGSVHNKGRARLCTVGQQTENEITLPGALAALRAAWSGPGFHDRVAVETGSSGPQTASDDDVASALSVIPNADLPWDEWKRICMAVWAATSGGGFALFDAWSRGSAKHTDKGAREAWRKVDRSPPSSLGVGSLFYLANEHDPCWSKPSEQVTAEDADFAELRHLRAVVKAEPVAVEPANDDEQHPSDADGAFPDHLTRPGGTLGWVVDWMEEASRQPSRILALPVAINVLGAMMGRRMAGPTGSGTHFYSLGLAPSAVGKQFGLSAAKLLLRAGNAAERIGHDDFMSQSALIKSVLEKNCSLALMDEFGAFLRKLFSAKASSHEAGISKVLRTLWGLSFEEYATPIWANGHSDIIEWPALSLHGVSTPQEFFAALRREAITDGFLNRFLLFRHVEPVRDREPVRSPKVIPEGLAAALQGFNMRYAQITAPDAANHFGYPFAAMGWANDGARDLYTAMQDEIFDLRQDESVSPFYGRTAEMAIRLATVHAAGRDRETVDAQAVEWGRDVARWSADTMRAMVDEHMAENAHADYGNRVVRFLRGRGKSATRREIQRHFGGALRVKELTDVLATLAESGRIVEVKGEKAQPGMPSQRFKLPARGAA